MTATRELRRPRILYLSFFFPPSRASGVYRGRATANYLAYHGWEVTVLAAPTRFLYEVVGSVDEGLTATVDPRIRIERPSLSYFPWERDLHRYSRFRGTMPILAQKMYKWGQEYAFPEAYSTWGVAALSRALKIHARRPFDVVLATGNPFASFASAWLFQRLTRRPYVVDYRDSWTLNLFTDGPAFPESHGAWKWERRILRGASAAVFVNEALRRWHAERYPRVADRMMVVPNGWDPDLMGSFGVVPGAGRTTAAGRAGVRRPLSFAYLGTLTNSQPVDELVDAFRIARGHPELADAELNINGHLGFFKNSPAQLLERLGLDAQGHVQVDPGDDSGIRYRGPVSKTEVASVYEQSDVLVFLAGGGRYVTSGKIFEYMASGKPVVSVHSPDIAAREVLDGYPLWFHADSLDVKEIAHSMVMAGKAARDLSPNQRTAAQLHAAGYRRERLLVPLEARLRSLVRRPVSDGPASHNPQTVQSGEISAGAG